MNKHRSDRKQRQGPGQGLFQAQVSVPMFGALVTREALQDLCAETERQVLLAGG